MDRFALFFNSLAERTIDAVARRTSTIVTVIVGNSGITALTESTVSVWSIRFAVPPVAALSESSDDNSNPIGPVLVTVNVSVAMVPVPLNAAVVEPVDVANKWYSPSDCDALLFTTSMG